MTRPNEYAEIQQDLTNVGAPIATPRAHQMGTTDYCMFLTQDISMWGLGDQWGDFYCPDAPGDRAATTANVYAGTTSGYDLMFVTPHSMLDVGPIAGQTRTRVQMFRPNNVYYRRPAYRSLHRAVNFNIANVEATTFAPVEVIPVGTGAAPVDLGLLTHRLGTTDVAVFATPSTAPLAANPPFLPIPVKVLWQPYSTDAVSLYLTREDGAPFVTFPPPPGPWTFDIMVVSRPATGHSVVYHDNRKYVVGVPPLSLRPDYRAQRRVNLSTSKVGDDLLHNDNKYADMLLFGFTQMEWGGGKPPAPIGIPGTPIIVARGGLTTSQIRDVNSAGVTNLDVLVVSPHSIFTSVV
jgi:hypothetical protein